MDGSLGKEAWGQEHREQCGEGSIGIWDESMGMGVWGWEHGNESTWMEEWGREHGDGSLQAVAS